VYWDDMNVPNNKHLVYLEFIDAPVEGF